MPTAALVTIIAAVVVVLVLAGFLLTIARVLAGVNRTLGAVVGAVGTIASKTQPVDSAVRSIDGNLATAKEGLSALLEKKVGADAAAQLVASVDPLAQAPPEEDPRSEPFAQPSDQDDSPAVSRQSAGSITLRETEDDRFEPEPQPQPQPSYSDLAPSPPVPGRSAPSIRLRDDSEP